MDIEAELSSVFSQRSSGPFLFLGSGFSRRYIGLEDWEGLLSRFCLTGRPYAFYKSSSNNDTPTSAKLIANDFHDLWWTHENYEFQREQSADLITDKTSPLRLEICDYLKQKELTEIPNEISKEIDALKECDVDGIITTNWDTFTERLFPDHTVYVGQKELLFSNTMNVGEIYKVHGCCTKPDSLILTDEDYHDYNNRNAYLASKLITIFVEHPVVFIGYSISDNNIRELLKSISLCIGKENIDKLRDNLIFIDRNEPASGPTIETSYLQFDSIQIPIKVVKTRNYVPVYDAIAQFERKLPARVLRFCKERVYEIVKGQNPDKKIAVIDYDQVQNKEDIEIVFGLGVIGKVGETGYKGIASGDIFEDLILNNKNYDAKKLIESTISLLPKQTKFVPIFKYLKELGITTKSEYEKSGLKLDRLANRKASDFATASIPQTLKYARTPFSDFLNTATEFEIFSMTPLLPHVDTNALGDFLRQNYNRLIGCNNKYHFRRLMAYYDWMIYGF
ncbi:MULTISPECIES: SIR2 family protein [Pseudomonas]|uniref:SIR2 family protein n=1 Tax=Pseudomonas taiwanensis TaxID=470150 RepID=A0A7L9GAY1_9PSED|nr:MULTISPECIES: SIR2 family protein [Pseudomonas]QOJ89477.1 SIR2 family protein [Pseudomonas taiwanensis]WQQ35164.1 SIR2 family protein [Pseudomonas putida]